MPVELATDFLGGIHLLLSGNGDVSTPSFSPDLTTLLSATNVPCGVSGNSSSFSPVLSFPQRLQQLRPEPYGRRDAEASIALAMGRLRTATAAHPLLMQVSIAMEEPSNGHLHWHQR